MANNYFQFKQFTIQQQYNAMKVCTDACLFGAWLANTLYPKREQVHDVLDIGCGTGLLSAMLAQQLNSTIDAVEIDPMAAAEAAINIGNSPWPQRIFVHNQDIKIFAENTTHKKYDLIVSNPPFFGNDLKSTHQKKSLAKHEDNLPMPALFEISRKLLKESGALALLLPWQRKDTLTELAAVHGFHTSSLVAVYQTPAHQAFRAILVLGATPCEIKKEDIIIRAADGEYSPAFTTLLKPYYLYL